MKKFSVGGIKFVELDIPTPPTGWYAFEIDHGPSPIKLKGNPEEVLLSIKDGERVKLLVIAPVWVEEPSLGRYWRIYGNCTHEGRYFSIKADYDPIEKKGRIVLGLDKHEVHDYDLYMGKGTFFFGFGLIRELFIWYRLQNQAEKLRQKGVKPVVFMDEAEEIIRQRNDLLEESDEDD